MKKRWMRIVAMFLAGASLGANAQDRTGASDEFIVNGLKVIVRPISANDIISVQLYLRGGSLNLTETTQGIESLIFESAVKGSKSYPREKLNTILDRTGARISSSCTKDFSYMSMRCVKSVFDTLWNVFADVIMQPAFIPGDVEEVRKNLLLGIKQQKDVPVYYLSMLSEELFYAGHAYRLNPTGVESSVSAITIGQMMQYLRDNLITSKLLLVVVGNVSKEAVQKKVESTFGRLPHGEYKAVFPKPVVHSSSCLKIIEQQLPTNHIRGSFAMPGPCDSEYPITLVLMNILRTRILEELMTKLKLSYMPTARLENNFANQGYFYVTTANPDSAVKVILGELKRLQEEPVSAKDLNDRIAIFLNSYNLTLETNQSNGHSLAIHELAGLGWQAAAQSIDRLRSVTADDVQRVARKYFHNMQTVIIGDPKLVDKEVYTF